MARKKLKKAQYGNAEDLAFTNDSLAIDTNVTNIHAFFDEHRIPYDGGNFDKNIYGVDTRISEGEIADYNEGRKILRNTINKRAGDSEFWKKMPAFPVQRLQMLPEKREGGEMLKSFKSAARFDQPNFKNGRRTKG